MPYILLYLFIEVLVSVEIAGKLGGLMTFLEIIISAIIGFLILANFRYTFLGSMQSLMNQEISVEQFHKLNLFTAVGAFLLIIPGFFSDILGVLLQFGFFGTLFAKKIFNLKNKKNKDKKDDDAIDVEIIDYRDIK